MKIFKHRNFMGLIYSCLVALPFIAVGVMCAYAIINKNAYQSFDSGITLNNVFTYSVNNIIGSNNFGNINFLEWFASLFLDMTNSTNALFLHFANWYLNYVLFVSCAYLIFLVLMWFINFVRRLLERGMNYDF